MKRLTFFSRTCTVPGGSKVNPEGGPLREVLQSRVVYRLYPDDRAVVYSGIDRGLPTKVAAKRILELIVAREKFDPVGWSFFDLLTSMHHDEMEPGDFEFNLICWRWVDGAFVIEGSIEVTCPELVLDWFDHYINSAYYADADIVAHSRDVDDDDDREPVKPYPGSPEE